VAFHIGWDAAPDFVTIGPHGQPADQFRVAIMAFNPYFPSGSSFGIAGMTEHTAYFVIAERTASLFIDGSLGNLTYGLPFQPPLGDLPYTLTGASMDFLMPRVALDDPSGLLLYLVLHYNFGATSDVAFWGITGREAYSVQVDPFVSPVPLPAALPLFAAGLGVMGLLGWRRKRKAEAMAAV
jgi:hypothetical protein